MQKVVQIQNQKMLENACTESHFDAKGTNWQNTYAYELELSLLYCNFTNFFGICKVSYDIFKLTINF